MRATLAGELEQAARSCGAALERVDALAGRLAAPADPEVVARAGAAAAIASAHAARWQALAIEAHATRLGDELEGLGDELVSDSGRLEVLERLAGRDGAPAGASPG